MFMNDNILVQNFTLKFVFGFFYWFENNICQNKSGSFSPKIGGKNCQNPFQAILKKVAWTTKTLGGGRAKP